MTASIIAIVGKLLFWALGLYMKGRVQDEEFYKSYLQFLEVASSKGLAKVPRLQASDDALENLKKRIEQRAKDRQREGQKSDENSK